MKFYAPSEQPIHVALTTGHTAVITQEGTDLEPAFHREAIARGAVLEAGSGTSDLQSQQMVRTRTIIETLEAARDSNSQELFTKDGRPDLRKLIGKLGFTVTREEVDAHWAEITADA